MKASKEILIAMVAGAAIIGWYLAGFWIGLLILAAGLFLIFRAATVKFVGEVKVELEKCSWPWDPNQTGLKKYKELIESTAVVIVSTVLLAGFVTTSDLVLAHVVGFLTGGGMTK